MALYFSHAQLVTEIARLPPNALCHYLMFRLLTMNIKRRRLSRYRYGIDRVEREHLFGERFIDYCVAVYN